MASNGTGEGHTVTNSEGRTGKSLKIAGQISQGDNSSEREIEELYQPGRFLQEILQGDQKAKQSLSQACRKSGVL